MAPKVKAGSQRGVATHSPRKMKVRDKLGTKPARLKETLKPIGGKTKGKPAPKPVATKASQRKGVATPQTKLFPKPWIMRPSMQMKENSLFSGRWAAAGLSETDFDDIYAKFVALDANSDGKISKSEFQRATNLHEFLGMSAADIRHLFAVVDADHSGYLDWEEFLYYMSLRKDHSPLALQKDPEMKRLDANIQQLGFVLCTTDDGLRGVAGDGNCQFYSLAWKLLKTTTQAGYLRDKILAYLREPATRAIVEHSYGEVKDPLMPRTFEGYLKKMAQDFEWGDEVTLQAAADLYQTQINVLTSSPYDPSKPPSSGGAFGAIQIVKPANAVASGTIWLAFAAQHYSPIDPTDSSPSELLCLNHAQ